mgnify:CR=1 FL=1
MFENDASHSVSAEWKIDSTIYEDWPPMYWARKVEQKHTFGKKTEAVGRMIERDHSLCDNCCVLQNGSEVTVFLELKKWTILNNSETFRPPAKRPLPSSNTQRCKRVVKRVVENSNS